MDLYELGSSLFGRSRAEDDNVLTDATTRTYIGTATSDSSDGSVYVALSEDVTMPDDYDGEHGVGVEMPTTVGVSEGDDVVVTVFGGGTMKAPVVTGNPGWGDAVQEQVNNAETLAEQAEAVASATGQHFWPDDDGVHVTEVTQDEWNDSTGSSYHSGANVLLNALGQLFRDGLNNLLALLPSAGETYTETFTAAADQTDFVLSHRPTRITSVTVDGSATSVYSVNGYTVTVPFASTGNVVEVTYEYGGTSIAIFDGNGNDPENVVASFGEGGTIIGSEYGQHVEVGQESVRIMGGQSDSQQMARFGSSVTFGSESDPMLVIANNLIHYYRFENLLISLYFDDDAAIQSYVDGGLKLVANGDISFNNGTNTSVIPNKSGTIALTSDVPSVTTGTVTRGAAASSWSSADLRKYGHVVTLNLNGVVVSPAINSGSTSGTIATVPAGFRPPSAFRFSVPINTTGNRANVWGVVGGGGVIQIANRSDYTIPNNTIVHICATYIVN